MAERATHWFAVYLVSEDMYVNMVDAIALRFGIGRVREHEFLDDGERRRSRIRVYGAPAFGETWRVVNRDDIGRAYVASFDGVTAGALNQRIANGAIFAVETGGFEGPGGFDGPSGGLSDASRAMIG